MSNFAAPLPDELARSLAAVQARLGGIGRTIHYFETIGSTNDVATTLTTHGDAEGAVVVAEAQTSGRGRRGRSWFSPPGAGLYVSVVLCPARARQSPERATLLLTLTAGVALAEAIERATGLRADIKWPNDLLVARRKLAGILAEGVAATPTFAVQAVVLGYGVNVLPAAYPPELADRATAIETELGRPVDRYALAAETLAAVAERYRDLLDARFDAILDAWRARAPACLGASVSWDTPAGTRTGTTAGIDDHGALLVRSADCLERLVAGEVRWN